MTARHPGDDQPHGHHVDPVLVALADDLAKQHVAACLVCRLAHASATQRATELDALGPLESTPPAIRDQFYEETSDLYCAEGRRLILALGHAAVGRPFSAG